MKTPRFYQQQTLNINDKIALTTVNHRHAVQVLRLIVGDSLVLFNGRGGEYHCRLIQIKKRESFVLIENVDTVDRESRLNIALALAIIKSDKMDFAIQKAVELGVRTIQPLYTCRSVITLKPGRLIKKMQHWQGVIVNACEQSGRTRIPEIHEPLDLSQYLRKKNQSLNIVMLPGDYPGIMNMDVPGVIHLESGISLLTGPEGGLTKDEVQQILNAGTTAIRFGPRILRAETAVIAGMTACQLRWGDLGARPRTEKP